MNEFDETENLIIMSNIAQVLSHPARLRILELLKDNGAYVMELEEWTGRPQANISQHLAMMRELGLVTDVREGMAVRYYVKDKAIFEIIDKLKKLAGEKLRAGIIENAEVNSRYEKMRKKCKDGKMHRGKKFKGRW